MTFISIVGLLSIVCSFKTVVAVRCLQCTDVANPFGCNTVSDCAADEQCFIQQSVTPTGMLTYSMGCRPSQQCQSKKRGVGDIAVCSSCCHSDYCNKEGCGTTAPALAHRGPKCFNCTSTVPGDCTTTTYCGADQECGLVNSPPGSSKYNGLCLPKFQCDVIEGLSTSVDCKICCSGDFCNDRCRTSTKTASTTTKIPVTTTYSTTPSPLPLWSSWGNWTCSSKFGTCLMTRNRQCTSGHNGDCGTDYFEVLPCQQEKCPGCMDFLNCSTQESRELFCSDPTWAVQYCRQSCGKCDEPSVPLTFSACGDPVDTPKCSLLNREMCLCKDPTLRMMCPHYCQGQCQQKPAMSAQCYNIQTLIGKRSKMLQYIMDYLN